MIFLVEVVDAKGKKHQHRATVGGGTITAEDLAAHYHLHDAFPGAKSVVVYETEEIITPKTLAEIVASQGKATPAQRAKHGSTPVPKVGGKMKRDGTVEPAPAAEAVVETSTANTPAAVAATVKAADKAPGEAPVAAEELPAGPRTSQIVDELDPPGGTDAEK